MLANQGSFILKCLQEGGSHVDPVVEDGVLRDESAYIRIWIRRQVLTQGVTEPGIVEAHGQTEEDLYQLAPNGCEAMVIEGVEKGPDGTLAGKEELMLDLLVLDAAVQQVFEMVLCGRCATDQTQLD
tara:strand:- start:58 stop:438 length:381 start_codon:yes stop_codon:yes gene_type:complete